MLLCGAQCIDGKPCRRQPKRGTLRCGTHSRDALPAATPEAAAATVPMHRDDPDAKPDAKPGPECDPEPGSAKQPGSLCLPGSAEPVVDVEAKVDVPRRRIDLVAHDIQGIIYYVDHDQQVYHIEDLLDERPNPRIVGYLQRGKFTAQ